jgi:hypothetical protein
MVAFLEAFSHLAAGSAQLARDWMMKPAKPGCAARTRAGLLEPGDAHRLSYVVNHVKGLLIVFEVKRNRRLVRQSIARGRNVLDQGASQGSERSLGRAFKVLDAKGQIVGLQLRGRWLAGLRVDLHLRWHLRNPHSLFDGKLRRCFIQ